jgi:hypothetical protein
MVILLFSSIPFFSGKVSAAPPSIIYQAPITIDNTQSSATPSPFQQMIQLNESTYKPYISYTASTANFEFSYSNNTIIPAWIESDNSGVLTIWLKLYSIPASSSITIYIDFASLTTNLLSSSGTTGIGEAPQLSPTYGEYDDGASVFSLYSNFYDTLAGYSAKIFIGNFAPTPTTSPYNSVELLDNSGGVGAYILSPNNISLGNYILQTYWSYSGYADGFSVSLWGNPNTTYYGGGGDSPGMSNGLTYHYEFYTGGGTPPSGNPNEAAVFSLNNNDNGPFITSAPASSGGTYYVYSQIAFYNIGSDSGTVAIYSNATTSVSTPNNIAPAELYSPTYQSIANFSSIPLSASPILFGAGSGAYFSYVYIYWALMRAYPPNGVMPSVSFGSVPTYTVTFTESGLPSGTQWSVTLNGTTKSSTTNTITFSEPNGTYSFTIATGNNIYAPNPSSGSFTVNGASVSESITFSEVTYTVTFTESGLPSDTQWSVTLNGTTKSSTTNTITFSEPNGKYSFTIATANKSYVSVPSSGTFAVNGANVNIGITFTRAYIVTFIESGLPPGTVWNVNLSNGQSFSSTNNTITFNEANGTYSYTVATSNKEYAPAQYSGSFIVNGMPVSESITFNLITYKIAFTESGLPSGTNWAVTLNNITNSSSNNTIIFNEPDGSYSYIISGISGYRASSYSGTINVNENSVSVSVNWTIITYPIPNGIPNGTSWSATLTGTTFNGKYINITLSSTTNTITFNEPDGSYSYYVHVPFGYAGRTKGNIIVSGQSVYVNVLVTLVILDSAYDYINLVTIAVWVVIIGLIGAAIAVIVRKR